MTPIRFCSIVTMMLLVLPAFLAGNDETINQVQEKEAPTDSKLVENAVDRLLELQHDDGAWPYEGVYRVRGKIPTGYRIGGTAIVCSALLSSGQPTDKIRDAVGRGIDLILKELENREMRPSKVSRYDVRIWGHIYALDLFCRIEKTKGFDSLQEKTKGKIQEMVDAVVFQEIKNGGWNYANKVRHCCFVTGPAVQSLLLAKECGADVPDEVLSRSVKVLEDSRHDEGVYPYTGTSRRGDTQAGSIARGPVSETTLMLLGKGDPSKLKFAIDSFHENWDELEKRRKKTGTHKPPHGIAPYYFYYGHRYAAQGIRLLDSNDRSKEFERFKKALLKTKDPDNTWNDRVFEQSKAYGTAMSVLSLAQENVVMPKTIKVKAESNSDKD